MFIYAMQVKKSEYLSLTDLKQKNKKSPHQKDEDPFLEVILSKMNGMTLLFNSKSKVTAWNDLTQEVGHLQSC